VCDLTIQALRFARSKRRKRQYTDECTSFTIHHYRQLTVDSAIFTIVRTKCLNMTRVKPWFTVYQRVTYVLRKKTTCLAPRSRILIRDIILTEAPCSRRQPFESGRPDNTFSFYVRRDGSYVSRSICIQSKSMCSIVYQVARIHLPVSALRASRRAVMALSIHNQPLIKGNFKDGWSEKKRFGVISQPR